LAGNHVVGPVSEKSSIGWYPVVDLVLKGLVLAGNSVDGPGSERPSIGW
jgi:hypothetical protein